VVNKDENVILVNSANFLNLKNGQYSVVHSSILGNEKRPNDYLSRSKSACVVPP